MFRFDTSNIYQHSIKNTHTHTLRTATNVLINYPKVFWTKPPRGKNHPIRYAPNAHSSGHQRDLAKTQQHDERLFGRKYTLS